MPKLNALIKTFSLFILVVFFSLSLNTVYSQVRYVKTVATGTGDGSSWANASSNLQAMIQASPSGGQVWVKSGTYYPTTKPYSGSSQITTADARDVTFHMKNNVSVYGGFAGNETNVNQRNIAANETILSGDIGVASDSTDNAYHVVMLVQTDFVVQNGVLDGFTVKDGNANGTGTVPTLLYPSKRNFGGGIYTTYANGTIRNCIVKSCAGSGGGGALFISRATLSVSDCDIEDNRSLALGGGVHVEFASSPSMVTVNHSNFVNNYSNTQAGAFYMDNGTLAMDNNVFSNNHSGGVGGALWASNTSLTIDSCEFLQNTSSSDVGAVYVFSGVGTISHNSFDHNQASGSGGAMGLTNNLAGNLLLIDNTFEGNTANNGGAISYSGGKTTFRRNVFTENVAAMRGGAIYFLPNTQPASATNNTSVLDQNVFINNRTTFIANINGGYGGAWFSQDGIHEALNNTFLSNSGTRGGAVYGQGSTRHFENNTFYNNSATYDCGAIAVFASTDTLINNIFFANTKGTSTLSESDVELTQPGGNVAFYHNALQLPSIASYSFATANVGNRFQINPLFVDPADADGADNVFFTSDDGFTLQMCSPLLDVGTGGSGTDILGNPRIQNGTIDLGAFESATANTIPEPVSVTGGGAYCFGESGLVLSVDNLEPGVIYRLLLNGIETGDTVSLTGAPDFGLQTNAGIYKVLAETIASGCILENEPGDTITIHTLPLIEINPVPEIICAGQTVTFNPTGGNTYLWSNAAIVSGTPFLPVDGETYILIGTDANGCENTDTLIVDAQQVETDVTVHEITISALLNGGTYQWINCTTGLPISGATAKEFTPQQNGSYAVIVNNESCSDTSDCVIITQVGLESMVMGGYLISPNPVVDQLIISGKDQHAELQLLDQHGRLIIQLSVDQETTVNTEFLAQGIYILRLLTQDGVSEQKIMKR